MPITLDPSLPEPLFPLAWLIGTWEGSGAIHRPGAQDGGDRRIEQQLVCTARADGTMAWRSVIHEVDDPAPLPPTSAFAREDAPAPVASGTGRRSLLLREEGTWTVGEPLAGQDLESARRAKPGDPSGVVSFALTCRLQTPEDGATEWAGEVRGPRIQLALPEKGTGHVADSRMFGYVGGRLMWLWERRTPGSPTSSFETDDPVMTPYLSVELTRA